MRPQSSGAALPFDFLEHYFLFAHHYPELMRDGWPRSWRHFAYGIGIIARAHAAEDLRMADAFAVGGIGMKQADKNRWWEQRRRSAGLVWSN